MWAYELEVFGFLKALMMPTSLLFAEGSFGTQHSWSIRDDAWSSLILLFFNCDDFRYKDILTTTPWVSFNSQPQLHFNGCGSGSGTKNPPLPHPWSHPVNSLFEPILLRSDDGSRATDSDPSDGLGGGETVVLHHVTSNQGTRPTQSGFAMHGNSAIGIFADLKWVGW